MESSSIKSFKQIMKGVGIALFASLLLLFLFSVILTFTDVSESTITPVIMVITGISILIGSIIGNSKVMKNGLLNGGLIGVIYILTIYLISSLLNGEFALKIQSFVMILIALCCGMIGGIIAVNKK